MPDAQKRQLGLGLLTAAGVGTPVLGKIIIGAAVTASTSTLTVAFARKISTMAFFVGFAILSVALIDLRCYSRASPFNVPVFVPWFGLCACMGAFAAAVGEGL